MSLDSLQIWKQTFKDQVVPVSDDSWKDNLSNWYDALFKSPKLSLPGLTISAPPLPVTFGKAAFKTGLNGINNTLSASQTVAILASAWESGILAGSVQVKAGDSIGTPSPATTWSVVNSCAFTPASIAAGKNKILELVSAPLVTDALDSAFPVKFREATLLLKVSTQGLDSTPAPTGPLALNDLNRAVG